MQPNDSADEERAEEVQQSAERRASDETLAWAAEHMRAAPGSVTSAAWTATAAAAVAAAAAAAAAPSGSAGAAAVAAAREGDGGLGKEAPEATAHRVFPPDALPAITALRTVGSGPISSSSLSQLSSRPPLAPSPSYPSTHLPGSSSDGGGGGMGLLGSSLHSAAVKGGHAKSSFGGAGRLPGMAAQGFPDGIRRHHSPADYLLPSPPPSTTAATVELFVPSSSAASSSSRPLSVHIVGSGSRGSLLMAPSSPEIEPCLEVS